MAAPICGVTFRVKAPVAAGERVCVVGSTPALGAWDTARAVPLECTVDR